MSKHKGEHPRMGATDVCPLIPVANVTMEEVVSYAHKLAERVGKELKIPVYMYEVAQKNKKRSNLSIIRGGEYEGFFDKIKLPEWAPDYGPAEMDAKRGATVIGARDFLIAYNVNLNTKSTRLANSIAFDVREAGRIKREGHPVTGKVVLDENGEGVRIPGSLKHVKAIGWYIEEYQVAQISMNLINPNITSVHTAFDEVCDKAQARGIRVTGSELVGMVPLKYMLEAGKHYLKKQGKSVGVSDDELIFIAVKSLGLDELGVFDAQNKIIEYKLAQSVKNKLVNMNLVQFANETASESPAPGGGSIAAYCGVLGVSLGTMVANLSAGKRGWENQLSYFSDWAENGQQIKNSLLNAVDEDTLAFNKIMDAFGLPKNTEEEKTIRTQTIEDATKYACEIPFGVMKTAFGAFDLLTEMVEKGNPNSITDAGVGILSIKTAVHGAYYNVLVNAQSLKDRDFAENIKKDAQKIMEQTDAIVSKYLKIVEEKIA